MDRFQDAYDKDREYVLDCHRRYDKKFKVYGKHSSIRWDSFEMTLLSNGYVKVSIIEDYSIDRQERNKYSVFVLEKHFLFDTSYHIVSVYDKQLSKAKGEDITLLQLGLAAYDYVLKNYANEESPLDVELVYNKVDFRENVNFCELVRKIVTSTNDYNTMMNSNVCFTKFMSYAMGKIESFEIQGNEYFVRLNEYLESEIAVDIMVNGHEYEWISSNYMSGMTY